MRFTGDAVPGTAFADAPVSAPTSKTVVPSWDSVGSDYDFVCLKGNNRSEPMMQFEHFLPGSMQKSNVVLVHEYEQMMSVGYLHVQICCLC